MNLSDSIKNRYSAVLFDSGAVEEEKILSLFEAAQWAPSARNIQPWRFYYCKSDSAKFNDCISLLMDSNQLWAKHAPLIVFTVAEVSGERGANRNAMHDTGMATANLLLKATEMGLVSHPMGGFDAIKAKEFLQLPENFEPLTMIAFGYPGDLQKAETELQQKEIERRVRKRKDLKEIITRLQ